MILTIPCPRTSFFLSFLPSSIHPSIPSFSREYDTQVHQILSTSLSSYPFRIHVLTRDLWSTPPECEAEELTSNEMITLPSSMKSIVQAFNSIVKANGRSYMWSFTRGFITLEMEFTNADNNNNNNYEKQMVEIKMLPIQAMVLLLFQEQEKRTFDNIREQLQVKDVLLKQVLDSLTLTRFQVGSQENGGNMKCSC